MIGETIEQYRILEVVGRGGMGVVYKALDVNLDRAVALKVMGAEFRDDPDFVERFRNEARVQAALNHPNVCTLFDFLIWNGSPVAVMEFISGETLQSLIRRRGPVPAHLALPIAVQALLGVAAGHRRGIIHRDLKPANLMITEEGIVKVTDFGIAKMQSSTAHTQSSTRVGSASYMSPEQILGRAVDVRTDIYAMGATLYELLCGRPPFEGKTQFEIESGHVRDAPQPPSAYYPHIPPAAVDAVMRALAKEPSQRFASAEEFMQALPSLHGVAYVGEQVAGAGAAATVARPAGSGAARAVPPSVAPTPESSATAGRAGKAALIVGALLAVLLAAAMVLRWTGRLRLAPAATIAQPHEPPAELQSQPPSPSPQLPGVSPEPQPARAPPSAQQQEPIAPAQPLPSPPARQQAPERTVVRGAPRVAVAAHDLSGLWTGAYADASGHTALRVAGLQIRQLPDDSITGSLTYATADGAAATCSLQHSTYSAASHRLRVNVHCASAHPRYLNVPLVFVGVDPGGSSIGRGHLEPPLPGEDILVTLTRQSGSELK